MNRALVAAECAKLYILQFVSSYLGKNSRRVAMGCMCVHPGQIIMVDK